MPALEGPANLLPPLPLLSADPEVASNFPPLKLHHPPPLGAAGVRPEVGFLLPPRALPPPLEPPQVMIPLLQPKTEQPPPLEVLQPHLLPEEHLRGQAEALVRFRSTLGRSREVVGGTAVR